MAITNRLSGTNVCEVADGIYRINTPVQIPGAGGFSFNQYLIADDAPLLFHTGPRKMFPLVREAVASVLPVDQLRYVALSHVEADECGSLNEWLSVAPQSLPLCGTVAALVSIGDLADRAPRALTDGEVVSLGTHRVRWLDTPHLPHAWECGFLVEESTRTLLEAYRDGDEASAVQTLADLSGILGKARVLPLLDEMMQCRKSVTLKNMLVTVCRQLGVEDVAYLRRFMAELKAWPLAVDPPTPM